MCAATGTYTRLKYVYNTIQLSLESFFFIYFFKAAVKNGRTVLQKPPSAVSSPQGDRQNSAAIGFSIPVLFQPHV